MFWSVVGERSQGLRAARQGACPWADCSGSGAVRWLQKRKSSRFSLLHGAQNALRGELWLLFMGQMSQAKKPGYGRFGLSQE